MESPRPGFRKRSSIFRKLALAYILGACGSLALAIAVSSVSTWRLINEVDSAAIRERLHTDPNHLLMLSAVILMSLVGFALIFSHRIGAALRRTGQAVERAATVDLERPIEIDRDDEIGQVQAGVETLRRRLLEQIRTLDERVEEGLREIQFQRKAIDEHAIVSVADRKGRITYVNSKFCEISGYSQEELMGQDHRIINSGRHPKSFFKEMYTTIGSGEVWRGEICNRAKDGSLYWVDATIVPALNQDGEVVRYTSIRTEVTQRKVAEERFATAVRGSRDGLWDWDLLTGAVYYAPQFCAMLGIEQDAMAPTPEAWFDLILPKDLEMFREKLDAHITGEDELFECELRMMHADGGVRWMLCRGAAVRDAHDRAIRMAGSLAEFTEIKKAQRELKRAAEHDRLTDLPNRKLFIEHVERAIEQQDRNPEMYFAILFFDFDRFKVINDSLGHRVGDELLISIANRFRSELRPYDVASRFGGDEFVVLLNNLSTLRQAHEIAQRLLNSFSAPHQIGGHNVKSTASIGLVMSNMGYNGSDEMIRDADAAMYQAKSAGRARVVTFDSEMHRQAMDRLTLEEDLEHAMEREEMRLVYQPILNLDTGGIEGFEALIRWHHPTRGVVPPDDFIGIAEDNGRILDIGEWVLRTACAQIREWNTRYPATSRMFMNVNISKRQLIHPEFIETLQQVMDEAGIEPSVLKVEITESTIVDNRSDIIPTLERVRALGVRTAMDDFGTGHSSLSGLHRFPIDILKIDRSFIKSMEQSKELAAVVYSIVTLAQHLGMEIVAEGVETPEQIAILQSHGVQFGQGYHFSRPLPASEAEEYILSVHSDRKAA